MVPSHPIDVGRTMARLSQLPVPAQSALVAGYRDMARRKSAETPDILKTLIREEPRFASGDLVHLVGRRRSLGLGLLFQEGGGYRLFLPHRLNSRAVRHLHWSPHIDPETMTIPELLRLDLRSFGALRPSWVGKIAGLTPHMERLFYEGFAVARSERPEGMAYTLYYEGVGSEPATEEMYTAFMEWRRRMEFPRSDESYAFQSPAIAELTRFLGRFSIRFQVEFPLTTMQARYLLELLKMVEGPILSSGYIREICISQWSGAMDMHVGGRYDNGTVLIYPDTLRLARLHFLGAALHELGHSTAHRYKAHLLDDRPDDPNIPTEIKRRMINSHQILRAKKAIRALDWHFDERFRQKYMEGSFSEFIAELHLVYVVEGPWLRQIISFLPEGSEERAAYEFVYEELKRRVFKGQEY